MAAPTCEDLCESDDFELVHEDLERWRHGVSVTAVFHRKSDTTFWQAIYEEATDGETNGLRDGDARIKEVQEYFVETVTYRPKEVP